MSKLLAYLGLFISVTIWSASFVAIEICLAYMSPLEVNVVRFALGSLILWGIYLLRGNKMAFEKKDQFKIAMAGVFGTAGYYHLAKLSMTLISPSMMNIATGAIPMITLIIAMLFFGKRTRFRNIFFIAMSFVGIIILTNPFTTEVSGSTMGIGLAIAGNVCWVIYTLVNEPLVAKYDKLNLLTLQMSYGAVALISIYWYQVATDQVLLLDTAAVLLKDDVIVYLGFITVFASIIAYHFYNYALEKVGVTLSALFINVIPVTSLIISVASGTGVLTFNKIVGCTLVVLAVYLIEDI